MSQENYAVVAKEIVVEYKHPSIRTNTLKETVVRLLDGSLEYKKIKALDNVTINAKKGECVSIFGHNGSGKSTMLKTIAGILTPSHGSVSIEGRYSALIELGAGFDPELTGVENIYLACAMMGLGRVEIQQRIQEIIDFSELGEFIHFPIKTYSSGMYMRLGFACSTAIDPDVILIDEILSVGDERFQAKCLARIHKMREEGKTIVLVSHDLNTMQQLSDRVYLLAHGKLLYEGKFSDALIEYRKWQYIQENPNASEDEKNDQTRRLQREVNDMSFGTSPKPGCSLESEIKSASIESASGKNTIESGKPWKLTIEFESKQKSTEPRCVGFAIFTEDGRRLCGGNNKYFGKNSLDQSRLQETGLHQVTYEFDNCTLATGKYLVDVAIYNWEIDTTADYCARYIELVVNNPLNKDNFDKDVYSLEQSFTKLNLS